VIYLYIAGTSPFLWSLFWLTRCAKAELGWLEAAVQQFRPERPAFSISTTKDRGLNRWNPMNPMGIGIIHRLKKVIKLTHQSHKYFYLSPW
jgi:hypothetical protein